MRFPRAFLTLATGGLIVAAAPAQDAESPSEKAEPKAEEKQGLSDLEDTVSELRDEQAAEPDPAPPPEAPPAETPAPPPAETPAPPSAEEPVPPPVEAPPAPPEAPRPAAPAADAPSAPAPALTATERAEVERTADRGRQLIALARAGIIGTQDMLSRVSDPEGAGIAGWIAEPEGNSMTVTFYADVGEGDALERKAVYRANVLGGRVVSREIFLGDDRPPLRPQQQRMAAARAIASGLSHQACGSQPFNVLVIPPASPTANVDVYQVSSTAQRGHFPLGGHFRTTVAPDGSVVSERNFANSCVDIVATPVPEGQRPRPIGVTHLLDPMPTEMHMFLAQLASRPLLVATGEPSRVWAVTGEAIAEVRP